jgi:hypothetical protein
MDDRASFCAQIVSTDKGQASHWHLTFNNVEERKHYVLTGVRGGGPPTPQENPDPENIENQDIDQIDHSDSESDDGSEVEEVVQGPRKKARGDSNFEILFVLPGAGEQGRTKTPILVEWFQGQLERGAECGTIHIHLHIKTNRPISWRMLKALLDDSAWAGAHIEKVKDIKAHMAYVTKFETRVAGPFYSANCPDPGKAIQGARTDWEAFKGEALAVAKNPSKWKCLWDSNFHLMLRYYKGAKEFVSVNSESIARPDHEVIVLYGQPGSGKSTLATKLLADLHEGQDPYFKGAGKWFDGYTGQLGVVMDDFDCSTQNIQALKNILDKTPCTVEVKGSTFPLLTRVTVITTNTHPLRWGTGIGDKAISQVDREAVIRRCHFFEMNLLEGRGFAPRGRLNDRGLALKASIHAALERVWNEEYERPLDDGMNQCRAMRDVTNAMVNGVDNIGGLAPYHVAQPMTPANPARPTAFMPAILRPQARMVDTLRNMREEVRNAPAAAPALVVAPQNAERPAIPIIVDDSEDEEIMWLTAQLARNRERNRHLPIWGPNGFEAPVAGSPVPEEGSDRNPIEL